MASPLIENKIWINDIPIDFTNPFEIRLSRGLKPWHFEFYVPESEMDVWGALEEHEVEIRIETPADDPRRPEELILKKWYVVSTSPVTDGMFAVEVADVRWFLNHKKITGAFNSRVQEGTANGYREVSMDPDRGGAWLAYRAIEKVIKDLGGRSTFDIPADLKTIVLPPDLGDFFGVWHSASMAKILDPFLKSIRCDIRPDPSGKLAIIARRENKEGETSAFVESLMGWAIDGVYGKRNVGLQIPETIKFQFPERRENRFEVDSDTQKYVSSDTKPTIENVVPVFDESNPQAPVEDFAYLDEYVKENLKLTMPSLRERITGPRLVDTDAMTNEEAFNTLVHEDLVRTSYRKIWRVENTTPREEYVDMQLGRVQPDGTNKDRPVFADYTAVMRWGWKTRKHDPAYMAKFSRNFPISGHVPAPYTAAWLPAGDELIFQLTAKNENSKVRHYHVGLFAEDMKFGNPKDILNGSRPLGFESNGRLATNFNMHVYWHGFKIGEKFELERSSDADTNGGHVLEYPVYDLPAVFSYENANEPSNLSKLEEKADEILARLQEQYKQRNAGIIECSGIGPIADGLLPTGEIHDLAILVGGAKQFTIVTKYQVLPGLQAPARGTKAFTQVSENV